MHCNEFTRYANSIKRTYSKVSALSSTVSASTIVALSDMLNGLNTCFFLLLALLALVAIVVDEMRLVVVVEVMGDR